jgi:hypothetical protein
MLSTGWAGYQIFNTAQFRGDFARLITHGACDPISLLPSYWQTRVAAEIASLVLNVVALLVSAFLSWRLAKVKYNLFYMFTGLIIWFHLFSSLVGRLSSASGRQ